MDVSIIFYCFASGVLVLFSDKYLHLYLFVYFYHLSVHMCFCSWLSMTLLYTVG